MTVGFFSPLPPARTGVADYSAALLAELRRHVEVRLNDIRCDGRLYHIGNNAYHGEIYETALRHRGIVVLHDATLHHLLLGRLDRPSYVEEFVYNYGEWGRELGEELWRQRARAAADGRYFECGMLRRIGESAAAVVVHNPGAAAAARRDAPAAAVTEIPHLLLTPAPPDPVEILRTRERLGIPPGGYLFGVFGHLRESKRIHTVLRAFRRVRAEIPNIFLLLAGDFVSPDLERALERELPAAGVVRVGHTPERKFTRLARAADACINLRYPGAGETSGIAMRLMGAAKPVIVTDGLETSRFPETACLRVEAGPREQEMLEAWMRWLSGCPQAGREIGRRAAEHVAAHHSPGAAALAYLDILRRSR